MPGLLALGARKAIEDDEPDTGVRQPRRARLRAFRRD